MKNTNILSSVNSRLDIAEGKISEFEALQQKLAKKTILKKKYHTSELLDNFK